MATAVKKNSNSKDANKLEYIKIVNKRKHNKTWAAAMKTQGCLIINDPKFLN